MGFLSRLFNLVKGFLSIFVGRLEEKNPEIAYENAINNMTEKYSKLKSAAAGLIKNRAKLEARIKRTESQLESLNYKSRWPSTKATMRWPLFCSNRKRNSTYPRHRPRRPYTSRHRCREGERLTQQS